MSIIHPTDRAIDTSTESIEQSIPPNHPSESMIAMSVSEIIHQVTDVIAPVTPLQDYVAVNPYLGIASRPIMDGRAYLRTFSDTELLMPLEYFAKRFQQTHFNVDHIEAALNECGDLSSILSTTAQQIASKLSSIDVAKNDFEPIQTLNHDRRLWTMAELAKQDAATRPGETNDWCDAIVDEIGKHCAAHYDGGQAAWGSPFRGLSLYAAWKEAASIDRSLETLGLAGVREVVKSLSDSPEDAIQDCLEQLRVPPALWTSFLLCQAFTIPGWSAWAKYQDTCSPDKPHENVLAVLAMRLAYDVAVANHHDMPLDRDAFPQGESNSFAWRSGTDGDDSVLRKVLLHAAEIGHRESVMTQLDVVGDSSPASATQALSQVAFCIDVRSERFRRHLESANTKVETLGFAGFFAMPIEFVPAGHDNGVAQVPVLLQPQFSVQETLQSHGQPSGDVAAAEARYLTESAQKRSWNTAWTRFRMSAVGCFSFVETTGLFFAPLLLRRSLGWVGKANDAVDETADAFGPTFRGLEEQGIGLAQQTDLAEGMLRGMSLTKNFAKLVVFAGHGSQTENNPLAAGLECGACGGHSGEPNARFAAMLLNATDVRSELAKRGIVIPDETYFLGGLHNTTTDSVELFDTTNVPAHLRSDLQELRDSLLIAGQATRIERDDANANADSEAFRRATEWSEVRPEWGLAGNAAFIVGPRSLTKVARLDGRAFLHQYDESADPGGAVLEAIMTAPLVVAQMINLQYYASTVDNRHFGSGNKTVHNVVGKFGILSGNSGDLQTGLPLQSLHDGHDYQHQPLRLQSIFVAKRSAIEAVVEKHELLQNLLSNGWLNLIAIEDASGYRLSEDGSWHELRVGCRQVEAVG